MNDNNELLKRRTWAMTTDLSIVSVTNFFLMSAFTNFVRTIFFYFPLKTQLFLIQKLSAMTSVAMISLMFAYFSLFYYVTNGQTMGKTIFGLRVVNEDKSEITLIQSMKRALAYFVCTIMASFLFFLSFVRKDQKSLADLFSSSVVCLEVEGAINENLGSEFQLTLLESIEADIDSFDRDNAA